MKNVSKYLFVFFVCISHAFITNVQAQREKILCNGEERYIINIDDVKLSYDGPSIAGTFSSLYVLGFKLNVERTKLQEIALGTQQLNEIAKLLVTGYNNCVISKEEYLECIKKVIPRLLEDGRDAQKILEKLQSGKKVDEKKLDNLIDDFYTSIKRFSQICKADTILNQIKQSENRIINKIEQEGITTREVIKQLFQPTASPEKVRSSMQKRLISRSDEADSAYANV